ncbi:hypothetical protein BDM02DRAFT_3191743 [Thelephora ganbajun]|uniref:Uncharacterized protein n=1 Tax=Thelephora ganbajun TaxID=370292 RepID=A0ACB6Z101_THEGA|nr:hypothetical protein BDM02DRAFT_3191743 [Thelephora ganbajun]
MSSRSFESLTSSKDSSEDRSENYDIIKEPEGGVPPGAYLATCKRGRLKRRTVVLKKVLATENTLGSVAVHQALCHPTILSLFSTFPAVDSDSEGDRQMRSQIGVPTTVTTQWIVLEHCGPHGTLSNHLPRLNPASTLPLEESRIRGVVKTLAEALTYLEKENVVHRRLTPECVYVTEDFRVKLGGFDSAIRISADRDSDGSMGTLSIPKTEVEGVQHHLAPEIKAGMRYDCSSDLWSLGLLILWMLDPSRGPMSKLDSIRVEGELGTLVSQLLEKAPERRIKIQHMCHHPFLDPRFPVQNLDPSPRFMERQKEATRSAPRKIHEFEMNRGNQEVAASRKPFGELNSRRYPLRDLEEGSGRTGYRGCFPDVIVAAGPSTSSLPSLRADHAKRRVISDPVYGTKERRKFLDPIEEMENEPESEERPAPEPRVRFRSKSVAAVLPLFLQARGGPLTTGGSDPHDQLEDSSLESSISILGVPAEGEVVKDMSDGMNTEELLKDFEEAFHSPLPSSTLRQAASNKPAYRIKSILETVMPESHSTPAAVKPNVIPIHVSSSPPTHLPPSEPPCHPFDNPTSKGIGVPRPKPFNTSFLPPQTHKVARGQLVVLPSRTLLVDFREGERRQGRQGIEVLTISPDGEEINVFSAPHMSSPCCLVEPSATYKLGALPKPYWKLYTTAGKFVEQIKQHIPRLVLYESDSKFTLMANFPGADVEAVFYCPEGPGIQPDEGGELPGKTNGSLPLRAVAMRIKIMRSRQLVEVSRQVLVPGRGRKCNVKPGSKKSPLQEKEGEWRKVVLVAPGGDIDAIDQTSLDGYERNGLERTEVFLAVCRAIESGLVEAVEHPQGEISCSSNSLSSILACKTLPVDQHDNDVPRESESIGLTRKLGHFQHSMTPTTSAPSVGWNKGHHGFPFEPPSLTQQPGGFETRFIPSVGWCVRYVGPSGGAGRYRMMFFDGKTLEVDVDEECVELMDSVRDEIVKYKIRECSSKREIMEKMRVFKEFVSMFDDGSDAE